MKLNKLIKKIPYSTKLVNHLRSKQIPDYVIVHGNKMFLQKSGSLSWELTKNGIYEKDETHFIMSQIKINDIVVDIGANIGYYALLFAKLVGDNGKVFAFEAETKNFDLMNKNLKINNFNNILTNHVALSNENGKIKLYLSNKGAGQHKIYPSNTVTKNFEVIDTIKLDDYFRDNPLKDKISFIKIDTEGSELGVLKGMKNILKINKKLKILIEFEPELISDYGANPEELIELLNEEGFNFSVFNLKNKKIEQIKNPEFLLQDFNKSTYSSNIICTRN